MMTNILTIDIWSANDSELDYAKRVIDQELARRNNGLKDAVFAGINGLGKIDAIKWLRATFGGGLKECKDFVEAICDEVPRLNYGTQMMVRKDRNWPPFYGRIFQ